MMMERDGKDSTPTMSETCLTCSTPCPSSSTSKLFRTSCCDRPICAACIQRNPRMVEYVPCLWCGEGVGVVSTKRTVAAGLRNGGKGQSGADGGRGEEEFVLGDEDGVEDDQEDERNVLPPPAYQETGPTATAVPDTGTNTAASTTSTDMHHVSSATSIDTEEPLSNQVSKKHRVRKGETVRSLASTYNIDPYLLAKINGLPYSSLTTHPGVLQTRREVLVPSSATGEEAKDDPVEDEKRRKERLAKRFQLITKETDPWVARTYVAIHSSTSDAPLEVVNSNIGDDHTTEADYEQKTSREKATLASGVDSSEKQEKKSTTVAAGGIASAVEMFYEDEEWEAATAPSAASGRLRNVRR